MSIKQSEVADLREGDVVELRLASGTTIRGPLTEDRLGSLGIDGAGWNVRLVNGEPAFHLDDRAQSLTVVSRAPRLYVNHPRTEPVPGDVVRDADSDDAKVWLHGRNYDDEPMWLDSWRVVNAITNKMPARLRLLVDGTTGQVVP